MKIKGHKIEKTVKKLLNDIADIELYEWPPRCGLLNYQPIRPNRISGRMSQEQISIIHKKDTQF